MLTTNIMHLIKCMDSAYCVADIDFTFDIIVKNHVYSQLNNPKLKLPTVP